MDTKGRPALDPIIKATNIFGSLARIGLLIQETTIALVVRGRREFLS